MKDIKTLFPLTWKQQKSVYEQKQEPSVESHRKKSGCF